MHAMAVLYCGTYNKSHNPLKGICYSQGTATFKSHVLLAQISSIYAVPFFFNFHCCVYTKRKWKIYLQEGQTRVLERWDRARRWRVRMGHARVQLSEPLRLPSRMRSAIAWRYLQPKGSNGAHSEKKPVICTTRKSAYMYVEKNSF